MISAWCKADKRTGSGLDCCQSCGKVQADSRLRLEEMLIGF